MELKTDLNNMKLYDLVRKLLEKDPKLRDSDKRLTWAIWKVKGMVLEGKNFDYVPQQYFFSKTCASPASIHRARRKVQENHPELGSSARVQRVKNKKEATKGMFVYHEKA